MVTPVTAESMFEIRKKILNHPIINLHHTTNTNVIGSVQKSVYFNQTT
jgi:hypothetical protein